ncbi:Protein of unknown function [Pyronema omphalodes CBS 100304]|uniref:Uncharacterized protein n=1 Tax=Pyronema omphalodes (strain CBS 100304) TaxID=1076935 RepID=U4LEB9_PYROM|nr:Protein of unknown function [Pyronema omphalodes CBS 100304]
MPKKSAPTPKVVKNNSISNSAAMDSTPNDLDLTDAGMPDAEILNAEILNADAPRSSHKRNYNREPGEPNEADERAARRKTNFQREINAMNREYDQMLQRAKGSLNTVEQGCSEMARSIQQDIRRTTESLNALTASAAPIDGDVSVDTPIADADADDNADTDADDDAADHPDPSAVQTLKACKLPRDGPVQCNEIPLPDQVRAIRRLRLWLGPEWTKKRAEEHLDTKLKKQKSKVGRRYNRTENKKRTKVNEPPLLGPRQTLWRDREAAAAAEALNDISEAVANESGVNVDGSNPAGVVIPDEEDDEDSLHSYPTPVGALALVTPAAAQEPEFPSSPLSSLPCEGDEEAHQPDFVEDVKIMVVPSPLPSVAASEAGEEADQPDLLDVKNEHLLAPLHCLQYLPAKLMRKLINMILIEDMEIKDRMEIYDEKIEFMIWILDVERGLRLTPQKCK